MANLFDPDDISLFLHHILLPSQPQMPPPHAHIPISHTAPNVSVGNLENEVDYYDYESEEGVEETEIKTTSSRSSSKRSRAAEVHNLSEKRRRSRINEKMKALQNLIPNSNKTDKASMLDEAIEYLKQLQLQVQMLTMRNGLSIYPISVPGMLQPNQTSQMSMDVYDSDKFSNVNMANAICTDKNISPPATDFPCMVGPKSSFEEESCVQLHHFGAFQLSESSKGICEEKVLPCRPLIEDRPHSSSGANATSSTPCETETSNMKGKMVRVCQSGDQLLDNFVNYTTFQLS